MDQYGSGGMDYIGPVYHASYRIQRGNGGIGSFLGGLFRIIRPLFVRGAKIVGKQALNTGSRILSDIVKKPGGDSIRSIVKKRISEVVDNNMIGRGGKHRCISNRSNPLKKRSNIKNVHSLLKAHGAKVKLNKRTKRDIFES